jgi:hypothetical protein
MSWDLKKFYWVKENVLSSDFCESVIQKFEEHPAKFLGKTVIGYDPETKQSTDLEISKLPDFAEEDIIFAKSLSNSLKEYGEQIPYSPFSWGSNFADSGYRVQRTEPGQFFTWHNDFKIDSKTRQRRIMAFIWYLNDIFEGGETEFSNGLKITPKQGTILIFPIEEIMSHRGNPPKSETKYICTGWIHTTF